ncbi:diadenosine tetraphosphate hydrolase [Nosocomiicoccus sp. HMSC067E10]|uniref:HIT family protein n=1 Tax=Nosocomiicoccus sp. HMSC067E10 TaxID=1739271 RepID=UPI0008A3D9AF|nr:HIT family protein [Nosocomiicoccus sp. HMSC067E10]OFL46365.1 diadenosine tetraphosphate hydrolase [Nosocomiicoccus sp. HMSC067E10]
MSENKTVFEMIVDRDIDANIIYEDDNFIAFLDAFPVVKGHTLVVPKKRIENIFDLDDETANDYMKVIRNVSKAVRDTFKPEGLNVVQNNGEFAGQSVFHIHFHILPRYKDEHDGFGYKWEDIEFTEEEREQFAEAIKSKLDA